MIVGQCGFYAVSYDVCMGSVKIMIGDTFLSLIMTSLSIVAIQQAHVVLNQHY